MKETIRKQLMNQENLLKLLATNNLGEIKYFDSIGSTNTLAAKWLVDNKPNFSLIVANEQTQGKGRLSRSWSTTKGNAIAFSLLHKENNLHNLSMLSGIVGVSISKTIEKTFNTKVEIKWPNDLLINRKKIGGILVESNWSGDTYLGSIIGVGINIATESIPIDQVLRFPAGCLEDELEISINRWDLLKEILAMLIQNLSTIQIPKTLREWNKRLAFKYEYITLFSQEKIVCEGLLLGLDKSGALRILIEGEGVKTFDAGEISLRPSNAN